MRLWYARRGISWVPLLACLLLAVVAAEIGRHWPSSLFLLLPGALAFCSAAAGFVFDETATSVVAVTPRGAGWRRSTRCLVALLPAGLWVAIVARAHGVEMALDRTDWLLAGLGGQLLALGLAAMAARRQVHAPGGSVASLLVMFVLTPLVAAPFAGLDPVLPIGPFTDRVTAFWIGTTLLGAVVVVRGVRPGLR